MAQFSHIVDLSSLTLIGIATIVPAPAVAFFFVK